VTKYHTKYHNLKEKISYFGQQCVSYYTAEKKTEKKWPRPEKDLWSSRDFEELRAEAISSHFSKTPIADFIRTDQDTTCLSIGLDFRHILSWESMKSLAAKIHNHLMGLLVDCYDLSFDDWLGVIGGIYDYYRLLTIGGPDVYDKLSATTTAYGKLFNTLTRCEEKSVNLLTHSDASTLITNLEEITSACCWNPRNLFVGIDLTNQSIKGSFDDGTDMRVLNGKDLYASKLIGARVSGIKSLLSKLPTPCIEDIDLTTPNTFYDLPAIKNFKSSSRVTRNLSKNKSIVQGPLTREEQSSVTLKSMTDKIVGKKRVKRDLDENDEGWFDY